MNKSKLMNKIHDKLLSAKEKIRLILRFSLSDLKKRYSGSIGSFVWAYVQPLVTILVFWFVFQLGLKNADVGNEKFILWLTPAYVIWTYVNDAISQSTNALYEYSFLVKKVKFDIQLLPVVKVVVALIIHLFFILFCYVLYLGYGYQFSWIWLQLFYYAFAATCLLIGLSWIVSALNVFLKDVSQFVNILLQIGFWTVPVFWNPLTMQNEAVLNVLKLNPVYYLVEGYRETFVGNVCFWVHVPTTVYYWTFTLLLLIIGNFLFKKCSKHYADLL